MTYQKITGSFKSSNGSDTIFYDLYRPERPRALLQLSHGMCEYIGRYAPLADFLAREGFVVFGNDHLGHGRSAASEADYGYFGSSDGWRHMVEDLHLLNGLIRADFPGLPCFLLGHSMGSFLARAYLARYGSGLAGAIICGTSGGNPLLPIGRALTALTIRTKGERHRSPFIQKLMFGQYNCRYDDRETDFDWISRDREVVRQYMADARCQFVFTAAGFRDLLSLLTFVSSSDWPRLVPSTLPVLLISGDMDPVGDYGKGVQKVYDRLRKAGVADLRLRLYPGARHELLNETNREEVFADIRDWLHTRL